MVFEDYELIQTKRVNHDRRATNVFRKRLFNTAGGWSTVYTTAVFGAIGYSFGGITVSELVPTKAALTSRGGFLKYFSRAGVWVITPLLAGYIVGISIYGKPLEAKRLLRFRW
jgi:hypothetical protein